MIANLSAAATGLVLLTVAQGFAAAATPCREIVNQLAAPEPNSSYFILSQFAGHRNRVIDIERAVPANQEVDATLIQRRFAPSPDLKAELDAIPDNRTWRLRRAGKTSVYAVETVAGTASCESFTFFEAIPGKGSRLIETPPILRQEGSLCFNSAGWLAAVKGKPVFLTETDLDQFRSGSSSQIEAWQLQRNRWVRACHADLRFAFQFAASEAFCGDVNCGWARELALNLTVPYDRLPSASPRASYVAGDRTITDDLATMRRLADEEGWDVPVPTFGKRAQTSYSYFGPTFALVDAPMRGHAYLIRLGHATFGWRTSPDYLAAFYRLGSGGRLEPVAGFVIAKTRSPLVQAKIR